jgi:hypothetical protein
MKKFRLLDSLLVVLLALVFSSCENEKLVGSFPQANDPNTAEDGQFKAQIGGVEFLATVASATLTTDDFLVITAVEDVSGKVIILSAEDAGEGSFSLIAGPGTRNGAVYYDGISSDNPYTSSGNLSGSGQLTIIDINSSDLTVTGTFSFIGKRVELDANGDPVLDGNGDPVIQTVNVTPGVFKTIPYILDDTGGGGGGGGGNPLDEFYALVDGDEFFDNEITTTLSVVGGIDMVTIEARSSTNALMRIDLPLYLGEGTFPMESLSDGTKVIALYNSNTGGENLTSDPGSITIAEFDTELGVIDATFSFTGTDPLNQDPTVVEVTEGSFTVHFEGIPGSGPPPFEADLDGVLYEPSDISIVHSVFNGNAIVTIETTTTDNRRMSVKFPVDIAVGSYDMSAVVVDGTEKIGSYNPAVGTSINFTSNPGNLTISSYDTTTGEIEGSFYFTATDPAMTDPTEFEITNGTFKLIIL